MAEYPEAKEQWGGSDPLRSEVSLKEYRYSGKERDNSTGFYYYGARYYAPWVGRWMSCDPAGPVDGANLYLFVKGNPVSSRDRTGLSTDSDFTVETVNGEPVYSNPSDPGGVTYIRADGNTLTLNPNEGPVPNNVGWPDNPPAQASSNSHASESSDGMTSGLRSSADHIARTLEREGRLRDEYHKGHEGIKRWAGKAAQSGIPEEEIASEVAGRRNALRTSIRSKGHPAIDLILKSVRGQSDNPTLEALKSEKARPNIKPVSVASRIITSASKSNARADKVAQIFKVSGRVAIGMDVAFSGFKVATAPDGERLNVLATETGRLAAALAGGWAGTKLGTVGGGLAFGPVGAAVGAAAGGVAGAILGGLGGEALTSRILNLFQ